MSPVCMHEISVLSHRLSLGMSGFEQQAAGAVLDLTQDEEQDMKKMKSIKKWYRVSLYIL